MISEDGEMEVILRPCPFPLPDKDIVYEACRTEWNAKPGKTNRLLWPLTGTPHFFFKFANATMAEARNQIYCHDRLLSVPGKRAPDVYLAFSSPGGERAYIVQEYLPSVREATDEEIADAVVELRKLPVPPGASPGPIGGGKLHHQLYRDCIGFREFKDNEELSKHMSKIGRKKVVWEPDDLHFYYTDLRWDNFGIDEAGNTIIYDFDVAGIAPRVFQEWGLMAWKSPAGYMVLERLGIKCRPKWEVLDKERDEETLKNELAVLDKAGLRYFQGLRY